MVKDKGLRVRRCVESSAYGTRYAVVISGDCVVGTLLELRLVKNGMERPFAMAEVMERDVAGDYQARVIWTDPAHIWSASVDCYVYPHVLVRPQVGRAVMEQYMDSEGRGQGMAHVLDAHGFVFVVYRRTNVYYPWVCLKLDPNNGQYAIITEKATLAEIQEWLATELPGERPDIMQWGTEGARVFNLLDHGVAADGKADDTHAVNRVLDRLRRGDVVYLPGTRKLKLRENLAVPFGVVCDIRPTQVIVEKMGESDGRRQMPISA